MNENFGYTLIDCMIVLWIVFWVGSALAGMIWIGRKGYFTGITWNVGCPLFVLFGWWAILLLLILGPIWLLIAAFLKPKQRCPHCKGDNPRRRLAL
jgi:hypothetical protein